jgi:hypothetical protein
MIAAVPAGSRCDASARTMKGHCRAGGEIGDRDLARKVPQVTTLPIFASSEDPRDYAECEDSSHAGVRGIRESSYKWDTAGKAVK